MYCKQRHNVLFTLACVIYGLTEAYADINTPPPARHTLVYEEEEREYYVRLPLKYESDKTYWPLVSVYGGGNNTGLTHYLAKDVHEEVLRSRAPFIVISPSFSNMDKEASRFPSLGEGAFLQAVLEDAQQRYRLHPKILLTGYSRGGQFTHRFAMAHPETVYAVATFAAGTWTTPNGRLLIEQYGEVVNPQQFLSDTNHTSRIPERLGSLFVARVAGAAGIPAHPQSKDVPFLVMCGSLDTRYNIAWWYAWHLKQSGYHVETQWPKTPHGGRSKPELEGEFRKYSKSAIDFFIRHTSGK